MRRVRVLESRAAAVDQAHVTAGILTPDENSACL